MPAAAPAVADTHRTVVYATHGGQRLEMDIYPPKNQTSPAFGLLAIHGGGWVGGNRSTMEPIGLALSEKGFLVATVSYRFAPKDKWPSQGRDVEAAADYLRTHAKELGIDSRRIGSVGVSAGGHLSLWLGATGKVQAVGSISGIHDLREPMTRMGESYRIVQALLPKMDAKHLREASPILVANAKCAPTYFLHGAQDPLVPTAHSTKAHERLRALKVSTEVQVVPGMGHGLDLSHPAEKEALDRMSAWMRATLTAKSQ